MSFNQLKALRNYSPLTQAAFAEQMGVPFRTYQDLESGVSQIRQVHINAAQWALLKIASEGLIQAMNLPEEVIETAKAAVANHAEMNPPMD